MLSKMRLLIVLLALLEIKAAAWLSMTLA